MAMEEISCQSSDVLLSLLLPFFFFFFSLPNRGTLEPSFLILFNFFLTFFRISSDATT